MSVARRVALLVVAAPIVLAGCSNGQSAGGGASGGSANEAFSRASGGGGGSADAAPGATSGDSALAAVSAPRLIRTAEVVVEVAELRPAADRVRAAALGLGGSVASETTGFGQGVDPVAGDPASRSVGAGESVLVLRIPEKSLETAVQRVAAVGRELSRTSSSTDVTGDLADMSSRVATQKASVARVRALLARAISLQDVVLLESEVSKRESSLEALEARLATLTDRADLATLTAVLRTPQAEPTTEETGFVGGLHAGWRALQASTEAVLTAIGATLPIAVALAVLATPLVLLLRRRRRVPPPVTTAPSP